MVASLKVLSSPQNEYNKLSNSKAEEFAGSTKINTPDIVRERHEQSAHESGNSYVGEKRLMVDLILKNK